GLQNCEDQLRDYVVQQSLQDSVRFTGSVANVRDYLQAADVFVFPSEREAFGISVAEAMACALPVVTTDIEGISDVVVPGQTASVVAPGDGPALVDAICSLFDDEASAVALGDAGRRRAVEYFSETSVVASYLEMAVSLSPTQAGGAD
ncbi:MAG: glycosyltransferase, partial [Chromatiales bacterium]|nr:glycosyltransferase [Chromatiales bacterium]